MNGRHSFPLDLFSPEIGLIDPRTGKFPASRVIRRVGHDQRALLEAVAKRTFTPATIAGVQALEGRSGSAAQVLAEAMLDGATEVIGRDGASVQPRVRTSKQQDRDLGVDSAYDALLTSVRRLERHHPGLGTHLRALLDADDRAAYLDLRRLAPTHEARDAATQILRTLGSTERRHARRSASRTVA